MSYISVKIEGKDSGRKEMNLWGDTYEVKEELKKRGYNYSNGQWSRETNSIGMVEELRFLEENGIQTSVKTEGRNWSAYEINDAMVYDWQYRRQWEEEYEERNK